MLPKCFIETLKKNYRITASEFHIANEIMPGVVLHSTIDFFSDGRFIGDYKITTQESEAWQKTKQLDIYTIQLKLAGYKPPKEQWFLFEKWDAEKQTILGYTHKFMPIKKWKIDLAWMWLEARVIALQEGIKFYEERNNTYV